MRCRRPMVRKGDMHTDDRYRRAAAAGGVGIWEWNLVSGEIYVDPIIKNLLGYQDHELDNHRDVWSRLVHPEDKAAVSDWILAHVAASTSPYELEHRMLHRDGTIRWFLARCSVTRDATGTDHARDGYRHRHHRAAPGGGASRDPE